jgi:hypothetical protein
MTEKEIVEVVIRGLRDHPDEDGAEVLNRMQAAGATSNEAEEAAALVPMAYSQALLAPKGVRFPRQYILLNPDSQRRKTCVFSQNPIFVAALSSACAELQAGVSEEVFLKVAGRCSTYRGISEMVRQGSRLRDLVLVPPLIMTKRALPAPWWQFWRCARLSK